MKKAKRILALCGVFILLAMYITTLILAIFDSSYSMGFFKASVYCSIVIPVIIYSSILIYTNAQNRQERMRRDQEDDQEKVAEEEED